MSFLLFYNYTRHFAKVMTWYRAYYHKEWPIFNSISPENFSWA